MNQAKLNFPLSSFEQITANQIAIEEGNYIQLIETREIEPLPNKENKCDSIAFVLKWDKERLEMGLKRWNK